MSGRLHVDVHFTPEEMQRAMAQDVRHGLTAARKSIPPKYFYDGVGSELFEEITRLPEYYLTRTERALLERLAPEIMTQAAPQDLVELGGGAAIKTRLLLSAAPELRRYVPIDVSEVMLRESAAALLRDYPRLAVHGVVGDFERHLAYVPPPQGRRLVIFLGSTIGNLDPEPRVAFFKDVARLLAPGDRVMVGMDLVKDRATVEAAYNDSAGVTAAFNRNLLAVVNRSLGADFDPAAYRHESFFNTSASRIEMHLKAERRQHVRVADLDLDLTVEAGEGIHTENSYKFTRASFEASVAPAGLRVRHWYLEPDPARAYALAVAERA